MPSCPSRTQRAAPITLTHVTGAVLDFGTFTTGDTGGTVVVTRGGNGSATGDVTLVQGSLEAADQFTVEGDAGHPLVVGPLVVELH